MFQILCVCVGGGGGGGEGGGGGHLRDGVQRIRAFLSAQILS